MAISSAGTSRLVCWLVVPQLSWLDFVLPAAAISEVWWWVGGDLVSWSCSSGELPVAGREALH